MSHAQTSRFDGDLGRAIERLTELTQRACGFLDATTLNLLSFHVAVYLDCRSKETVETGRMEGELRTEQSAIGHAWRDMGREIEL